MAHTYASLSHHCVFSTKHRLPLLTRDAMARLVPYVGGIIRRRSGKLLAMDGAADHVHLLAVFSPKHAVSDLLRDIKADSSGWLHRTFPSLGDFAWQEGYGAFSVSKSAMGDVIAYIQRQEEHHREMTFEEEFLLLLKKHEIDYDPRYVLG